MLWTVNVALAGWLCLLVLAAPCCCEPLGGPDPRLARPKSFASPDDLRLYLDQLGQYFAVVGRPRFGKRTSSASRDTSVGSGIPSYSNYAAPAQKTLQADSPDVYDIFQYYQPRQQE
ncbi:uncharacterized protein LOC128983110 [Macrosteles quadrilineatus]|uniref:uncharacterized protein LOC128983110 n=1 Tax=Macrosteles quadrilineatus TaxID=74068 RepID=UPI0023E1857D|nr:uncharacterized protein LOC128983110 [Macrosteles quadrilineatus]